MSVHRHASAAAPRHPLSGSATGSLRTAWRRGFAAALLLALGLAASSPLRAQDSGAALDGTWRGSYRCAQGLTALTLLIQSAGNDLAARFEFSAHPNNPGVPSGSFTMVGRFDPTSRMIALRPLSWVERPPDYLMVGLSGTVDGGGATISGTVETEGCSTFEVARAGK